ncbi:hypothetical protein P2G88_18800 [Aliiglaciecola sp. CAU 1673]|uniref:hypothetical protein n=1 Tax=Aliiglaciecola sp. CAU 1673 TaxID=3032595 RepID=UPI0023DCDE17|nr:hypothetical protein [Aliiglaciecola sp. CAU 1673]MDF2180311.1 hypothetical protein [Aliiglaciecola sp. CAU 1673]
MKNTEFEKALAVQLEQLPREQQPERDLWPGIEHALNRQSHAPLEPTKRNGQYWGMAAAVAMVGMLSWFGVQQIGPDQDDLAARLSAQHQAQKQALLAKFTDQPALTENWQQQLKELDDAAMAIRKALENDPDNMAMLQMLQQVYQQQIDLIEKVHAPKWQQI